MPGERRDKVLYRDTRIGTLDGGGGGSSEMKRNSESINSLTCPPPPGSTTDFEAVTLKFDMSGYHNITRTFHACIATI